MSESRVQVEAEPRSVLGKKVRFLRRSGRVPANIFGRGVQSAAIQVRTREIEHLLAHTPRSSLLSLQVDGAPESTVLIKGVTRKPTTGELYHIDFYRVSMTQRLRADIPIVLVGTSPAVDLHEATLLHAMNTLLVECLPGDLPPQIVVNVERLAEIDDAIYVRDLGLPSGVTAVAGDDDLVVKALAPTVEVEEVAPEAEEAAAEGEPAVGAEEAAADEPKAEETTS
jgi:large subunit ribosomal protein L25